MNKLLIGTTMGMMMGVALMMSPMGQTVRRDVKCGMRKARKMAKKLDMM